MINLKKYILLFSFGALLLFPTMISLFSISYQEQYYTNKQNDIPIFNFPHFGNFRLYFDLYYKDNFGGRNFLSKTYSNLKYSLGISPSFENAIIGKEGWIFLGNRHNNIAYNAIGSIDVNDSEIRKIYSSISEKKMMLDSLGIKFYVVFAPNKYVIYPEYFPAKVRHRTEPYQILENILIKNNINVVPLKKHLLANKKHQIYYKKDAHWNKIGAFLAYECLINKIANDFPQTEPKTIKDYSLETCFFDDQDILNLINLDVVSKTECLIKIKEPKFEENVNIKDFRPRTFNNINGELGKIVVFRDSFSNDMIPYLQEHFKKSVFHWRYNIDKKTILKEKPNIVVLEIVQRQLPEYLKIID